MSDQYVYKQYSVPGDPDVIRSSMIRILLKNGYKQKDSADGALNFAYPSIRFSSKRPLTCISRLTLKISGENGTSTVRAGVTFTKIRYFNIFIFALVCAIIPIAISMWQRGMPDIPPAAYIGIPLAVMVHFHVRWRVFSTLKRLAYSAGGKSS